jgi:uncharacterized protein YukE
MANRIRADFHILEQAGGDMAWAANTTREAVGQLVSYSRQVTGSGGLTPEITGSLPAAEALYSFWYSLQEQLGLAGEVFDELGTGLKNAAAKYQAADQQSAAGIKNAHSKSPSVGPAVAVSGGGGSGSTGGAGSTAGAGADNNPAPVQSAPPPPDPGGGGDPNGGVISAPGSATPQ